MLVPENQVGKVEEKRVNSVVGKNEIFTDLSLAVTFSYNVAIQIVFGLFLIQQFLPA